MAALCFFSEPGSGGPAGAANMTDTSDPRERFSDRVAEYVRHRPGYPSELMSVLWEEAGFDSSWVVADVGSGTGLSTVPFLDHGNRVWAVEPNAEMRRAANELLEGRPGFRSVAGSAEATGLPPASVDLVAAGQAFHWFDHAAARREFLRILRPGRWAVVFWNTRRQDTAFQRGYENLLNTFGTDYAAVRHDRLTDPTLESFFGGPFSRRVLHLEQHLDLSSVQGRLLSTSYTPPPGHTDHEAMMEAARELFHRHQVGGTVVMAYDTEIYLARLR